MLIQQFYFVYFITNKNNTVLYIGVTNSLQRRIWEHKVKFNTKSFASKYNCNRLVYFETYEDISNAIKSEKQLKDWKREWKNELVEKENMKWKDIAYDWFTEDELRYTQHKDAGSSPA